MFAAKEKIYKMNKIPEHLKGFDLFYFMTHEMDDPDYSSVVALLPYAESDMEKACNLLETIVKDGKRLVAVYPGLNEKPTPEMELVGSIPDGALYIE